MSNKRGKIALLLGQADESYQRDFVRGVMKQAFACGYDVCVFSMFIKYQSSKEREKGDSNIFNLINFPMFDAVIIMSDTIQTPGRIEQIEESVHNKYDGPVICVDRDCEYFRSFWTDGYNGVYATISHLIEVHDYKDIIYLSGRPNHPHSHRRVEAYLDAMKDHGLEASEDKVFYGDFWYTGGASFAEKLLRNRDELPEAVACANDCMAIGLANILDKNGVRIPEDIAIVGYGSIDEGRNSPKALTSPFVPGEYYGKYAVEAVLNLKDGKEMPAFDIKQDLFIGESCGCGNSGATSLKRGSWETDDTEEGFYSLHNTMQDDIERCGNMDDFLAAVIESVYYLRNADRIDICLNDAWINRDVPSIGGFPKDGYSDKILWAINYEISKAKEAKIGLSRSFDRNELLPDMNEDKPSGYIFVPLYFEDYSLGYACVSFGNRPESYSQVFRLWSKAVARGLENVRRQLQIEAMERKISWLKENGSGNGAGASSSSDKNLLKQEELEELELVQKILDENLFTYHFQPIVKATDGEIYSYEALMRTTTEKKVSPLSVIRYTEMLGRMQDIEKATFMNVLEIMNKEAERFGDRKVFINSIPGCRLEDDDYSRVESGIIEKSGRVVIELTENAELSDDDLFSLKDRFVKMGAGFAIDDYGTGYSNVSNLLRYMPNVVKIDRSLLSEIQNSAPKEHFVRDIIEFCHDNNILALAEGVETSEELKCVIKLGADLIQGYYTARPSAEILDSIDEKVKKEIMEYNRSIEEGEDNEIFYAGDSTRISLSQLIREHKNTIIIGEKDTKFPNVTIVGAPGRDQLMRINILEGYSGQVTLENVSLSNVHNLPCITMQDNSNLTLRLLGANKFKGGGICVPESSKLTVEGEGSLFIDAGGEYGYGIGNTYNKKHGDLFFFQDGDIMMEINGTAIVGIGSGLGGRIAVNKGRYEINVGAERAVSIGSLEGDTDIKLDVCHIESKTLSQKGVGIGSLSGNVALDMEHCSAILKLTGREAVCVGSLYGKELSHKVSEITLKMDLNTDFGAGIAALRGKSDIDIKAATVKFSGVGNEAYALGGCEGNSFIVVDNCDTVIDLDTKTGDIIKMPTECLIIKEGRITATKNGEKLKL